MGGSDAGIEQALQEALDITENFLVGSGLSLSSAKSELLLYRPTRQGQRNLTPLEQIPIALHTRAGQKIPRVDSISVLGLLLESKGGNSRTLARITSKTENMLRLILRVSNSRGWRIENLTTGDDEVYEDGASKPRVSVPITLCFVIMIGYISGGAVIFSLWEGWEFLDGSYFCFVTLSTIGFGDLVPGDTVVSDSGSQEKLVICSLYLLVGMALIAMCFNLMQEEVIYKVRNCGKRIGIIKDTDDDEDFS
ncbi:TWiK family of potassium channels protein 12 [Rhipicephalus sanguineus]|uniref:TWiK family of potassium channels protein 12 n=1 Tax=Rhipicephalus sanguineus TaxID=34632 RepID=UPI0020C24327|nr:TWiK family of potassium channels protein 12 [Rhipicephalus sanguineus]